MNRLAEVPEQPPLMLRNESLELVVSPAQGCCCRALRFTKPDDGAQIDIFRPMPAAQHDAFMSGCFPLVPYSNRLFGARLLTGADCAPAEFIDVPLNRPGVAQPVHGLGWRRAWQVLAQDAGRIVLAYTHAANADWPFDHRCEQTFSLLGQTLRLEMELHNLSDRPMPAGLGFHPFFEAETGSGASVRFNASAVWTQDGAGLPDRRVTPTQANGFGFAAGRLVDEVALNHCYQGSTGRIVLSRPAQGLDITVEASGALDHLVIYRPPGASWICLEPVSHATGAFSLPALHAPAHGLRLLAPGSRLQAAMTVTLGRWQPA